MRDMGCLFNEIFYLLARAYSYDKIGILDIPVFVFRPSSVSQMDISNIVSQALDYGDFYEGFEEKIEVELGFFERALIAVKNIWKNFTMLFSGVFSS